MKKHHPILLLLFLIITKISSGSTNNSESSGNIQFEQNKTQWPEQVIFKANINSGKLYLEKNGFTYDYVRESDLRAIHELEHAKDKETLNSFNIHSHCFKVLFSGANSTTQITGEEKEEEYYNYFIGNNEEEWASEVALYKRIMYRNLYNGIHLKVYSKESFLKYDFIVEAGFNPEQIVMNYAGMNEIKLIDGQLRIVTSVNEITEQKPYAYQIINGKRKQINCIYVLNHSTVSFAFPDGYNKNYKLIIDPVVVASTLSGTKSDTFGHSATYDKQGNIFSGGRCFGPDYPTTTGAYQTAFGGGLVDVVISKLNANGSSRMYSTYLGGNGSDIVESILTDPKTGDLFVFGTTDSNNFPTTANAIDQSHNGDDDIFLSRLNSTGTILVGSTYVGGSAKDGINSMLYNYSDEYRGEIFLDQDTLYVVSSTTSTDFPVSSGAYQSTLGGGQDACVMVMNSQLVKLYWSSFLGGTNAEAGYSIRKNSSGKVIVGGITESSNFPVTANSLYGTYQGGTFDGYLTIFKQGGGAIESSTFYGTNLLDEINYIDLDAGNNIYALGITTGSITPTAGVYSNPGSGQFVTKFGPDLKSVKFCTVFGNGSIVMPGITAWSDYAGFSPTGFLVDRCENIYVSGWGQVQGFPITPNAAQSTTDNRDFYLMALEKNASKLLYATFYGSPNDDDHVDGGTCRFDKDGIAYQAVCSCNPGFPITPGALASVNQSPHCDIAVFKIAFEATSPKASAVASPTATGCAPLSVNFINSSNAVSYTWNFGDGSPVNTTISPSHIFQTPGNYETILVATDPSKCISTDTLKLNITVNPTPKVNLGPDIELCDQTSLPLDAGNAGATFLWSTGATTASIITNGDGTYWVLVSKDGCSASDTVKVSGSQNGTGIVNEPNIFSPNNDGLNDFYKWEFKSTNSYQMDIFNRWGQRVFQSKDTHKYWDGKDLKGRDLPDGTYFYVVKFQSACKDALAQEMKGTITLVR